ncbi:hypothetical protein Aduo_008519 [Ancylostoma duodenale]
MRWLRDAVLGLMAEIFFLQKDTVDSATILSNKSGSLSSKNASTGFASTRSLLPTNQSTLLAVAVAQKNTTSFLYGMAIWLHPSPTCDPKKDNRTVEMKIDESSPTLIVAMMKKKDEYREEWRYPIFVCTKPKSKPSEFNSIIIEDLRDPLLPLLYVIYCAFLLLSALFTGLNLSLMSLDMEDLRTCSEFSTFQRIKEYDENPKTRRYAANIIPIRENGNFMLCTIVLGNTICNAIDVLVFDRITLNLDLLDWERIILINVAPAMFIIVFSEIIPQVICTKFALPIGSYCRHLMVFFMVITYPASYPLSKLLDAVVGKEVRSTMDRRMLGGLMRQQKSETANMAVVVENAMMLQVRRVRDVMTPLEKVFMISDRTEINVNLKQQLSQYRHTRIPVYKGDDRNSVIGVLNVKDLLLIDDSLDLHVGAVMQLWNRSTLFRFVTSESPVVQLMLELKKGFPLAIVVDYQHDKKCYHVTGIVTLEDNLEEVIGEIYDEKDVNLRGGTEFSGDMSVVPSRLDSLAPADLPHKKAKKRLAAQSKEEMLEEKTPLLHQSQATTPIKQTTRKKKTATATSAKDARSPEESRS